MEIQLLNGNFSGQEAIEILTKMIQVKIQFYEQKINKISGEEEIKMLENRIKITRKELFNTLFLVEKKRENVKLNCEINID
jgi:rubrerythrin